MTPTETAERIASAHMHRDNPLYESLASAITTAIQAASDAQLNRDRAVIEAAKKAARIHRDAWNDADGKVCVLLEKVERQRKMLAVESRCNESLAKDLRNYREAIEWMGRMATMSGEGRAIYEALRRAIANPAERSNG